MLLLDIIKYGLHYVAKVKQLRLNLSEMSDSRYIEFFHAANAAHYKLMFIEAACIFDTDDRTDSLKKLKKLMSEGGFHDIADQFSMRLSPYKQLVSNILTIRSKLLAHKQSNLEPKELYQMHGVKPNDIRDLLDLVANLMKEFESTLNNGASWNTVGPTNKWEAATYELLEMLRKGRTNSG